MNSNRFLNKVLYSILFLAFTTLFYSCENFLNSSDVKEAIDKAIYIANSECPVATVEQPINSDSGVEKNKSIIVSFSLPIDPDTFNNSYQILDTSNKSLKEHFREPQWSKDNKTVTITADEQNLIDLGSDKTKDIYFKLSKNCTTKDDLPITQAINHKYRINNTYEITPPEILTVCATVPSNYISREPNPTDEALVLIEGEITQASEGNIITTNHINNKLDFYIEGNDNGDGRVWGLFKYHRLYDAVGNTVTEEEKSELITFTDHTSDGKWYGSTTLDLSDSNYLDGLYQVKVFVQDAYGTECESPKIYNIIRDTTLAKSINGKMNLFTLQHRSMDDIPEGFKYETTKLDWEDPARVMPEIIYNGELFSGEKYSGPDTEDFYKIYSKVATAELLENFKKWMYFSGIFDDVYFISPLTGKSYSNNDHEFTYYLSWGTNNQNMEGPVKLEIDENYRQTLKDNNIQYNQNFLTDRTFNLPENCIQYCKEHKTDDIYFTATYVDIVGNETAMTLLCPKQVDYHSYIVETDDLNSEAKKVTLSFSDLSKQNVTNMFNLPDKSLHVAYRVYYGKYEEGKDVSTIALNRNPSKPWIYDPWGGASDSNVIHNLEPDTKYVVYLQSYYETESLLNSQYTGGLPGPLFYKIIDTSRENGVSLTQPEFTLTLLNKKESAGQNTGLFNVPVKIENFANGVKYIPAYSIDNGQNWIYYEAQTEQNFTISVNNPLRMPTRSGEAWANNEWEYTPRTNSWGAWDDGNTYFIAIDRCRKLCGGYPTVKAQLKIIAEREDEVKESAIQEIVFDEYDDNIPPSMRNDIILHDSKLSFDGHSFTFNDLIYEDEGHLSEYFDFYYVPYQEMWGNNLNVLSEEEIKWLPSGVSSFNSNCWIDKGSGEAKYSLSMDIPVFGLADGKYMYFAKISDTFGNYKYVTLGQAHIGTFKNKLTVEYDSTNKRFISKLPIEADEENFNRYMINIQRLNYEDRKDTYSWNHQFDWSNELQDCRQTNQNGKTVLENISGVDGVFGTRDESDNYIEIEPKSLDAYTYYRITIQAFKTTDTYNYETRKGVDKAYGRPYTDISGALYDHDILGYVDNESEYDVCTDETVSNTVTMYIPPTYEQDPWWYYEPVQSSFFVDTATPRSNKDYFVQVIASSRDLGDDIDEWERRGKIVKTHMCNTGINVSGKFIANPDYDPEKPETTENPKYMKNPDCYPPNHFIDNENFDNTKDESEDNPKTIPDPDYYEVNQNFDNTKEESEKNPRYLLREQYKDNPDYNTFNASIALEDMYNSKEKGLVYYVVVAYFADNSRAMSKVYTMQGF